MKFFNKIISRITFKFIICLFLIVNVLLIDFWDMSTHQGLLSFKNIELMFIVFL